MTVGVLDAITGTSTNNSRGTEADGTFSSAAVAVNRYTGERVPVSGYARSFDTYDLGAGTDTISAGGGTQALFFSTAGSTRTDANGTNVASPAHFTSVEIFALGFGGDLLDLTAGGGGASSYAVGCAIYGDSPAAVTGTGQGPLGHDVLWGGAGDDTIFADAGGTMTNIVGSDDRLHGGAGADTLYGEAPTLGGSAACGADTLEGGAGNDTLHGDAATFSSYTGARGADDFVFRDDSGRDTIGDFQVGVDDIRISTAYGFDEFSDLTITGTTDAVISLDGTSDRITLTGVAPGSLTAADVEFFA